MDLELASLGGLGDIVLKTDYVEDIELRENILMKAESFCRTGRRSR